MPKKVLKSLITITLLHRWPSVRLSKCFTISHLNISAEGHIIGLKLRSFPLNLITKASLQNFSKKSICIGQKTQENMKDAEISHRDTK